MKVKYSYSEVGTCCDHCGRDIKHIYMIEDSGVKMNVGCKCIQKVFNISDYGLKVIKKVVDSISKLEESVDFLLDRDYEAIKQKCYLGIYGMVEIPMKERLDIDDVNYASYRERTFEEFKIVIEDSIKLKITHIEKKKDELNKLLKNTKLK